MTSKDLSRLLTSVAAAIALLAGVFGSASSAVAATKYSVSIKASPSTVMATDPVTISGKVSPAAPGRTVQLQRKLSGSTVWKTMATSTISSGGTYAFTERPSGAIDRQYRTYKPKTGRITAGYSKAVTVKVLIPTPKPATVTITSTGPTTLDAGKDFIVNGTTSANLKGKTVKLERLNGSAWSSLTSSKVSSTGNFALKARATQAGRGQKLRVTAPATPTTKVANSASKSFTVYGWYYLADLPKVDSNRFSSGSVSIAGSTYGKSVYNRDSFWWNSEPHGEWGLNYKCTQLRATIGLDDTSLSGSKVAFVASVDSLESNLGTLPNGVARPISVNLTGGYRLIVEDRYVSGPDASVGAWGNARIRCAF